MGLLHDNSEHISVSEMNTYVLGDPPVCLAVARIQRDTTPEQMRFDLGADEALQWRQRVSAKSQANYWAARRLGKQLLVEQVGGVWQDWQILNSLNGAPQVYRLGERSTECLSIAHSGEWVVCALSTDGLPVGVDIERMKPRSHLPEMMRALAHPLEQPWLEQHTASLDMMYRYWTAKEALAKWDGCAVGSSRLREIVLDFSAPTWVLAEPKGEKYPMRHFVIEHTNYVGAWIVGCCA